MKFHSYLLFALVFCLNLEGQAQAGALDPTFNTNDFGFGHGDGLNGNVSCSLPLPDGKVIVGGNFYNYNGVASAKLLRFNSDGSRDDTFQPGDGVLTGLQGSMLLCMARQSDGKILVGGDLYVIGSTSSYGIARFNTDGTIDDTFNAGGYGISGAFFPSPMIYSIAVLPNDKIMIGGTFTSYNDNPINRIARLNADGTFDNSFDPGLGVSNDYNAVKAVAIQNDGKVLIGGNFMYVNGEYHNNIARLTENGSIDEDFLSINGASNQVLTIVVQPDDDKILIGGEFTYYESFARNRIARINSDGTIDTTFDPGSGADDDVLVIEVLAGGNLMVGGYFEQFNGTEHAGIVRLLSNGTVDATYNGNILETGYSIYGPVACITTLADGKSMVGGQFERIGIYSQNNITRLNNDGSLDLTFNLSTGANNAVQAIAIQSDNRILIGGNFTSYQGIYCRGIARANPDGSLDESFVLSGTFSPGSIRDFLIDENESILVGGQIGWNDGTWHSGIVKLTPDGSIDSNFDPGSGVAVPGESATVSDMEFTSAGKILIVGNFSSFNGIPINDIARLNSDGSLDESFNPGTGVIGVSQSISKLVVLPDGKIVIVGAFTQFDGIERMGIARLLEDGAIDLSFDPGSGFNSTQLNSLLRQQDGKLIVGGGFSAYNGIERRMIVRILDNGDLDESFDPGTGLSSVGPATVYCTAFQSDQKIILGGFFQGYDGNVANEIVRINPNGSYDETFNALGGPNSPVFCAAFQPDEMLLIGGVFGGVNGVGRNRIARLCANTSCDVSVDENNLENIYVYPNPASNWLTLMNSERLIEYELVDLRGRVIHSYPSTFQTANQLYIGDLKSGIYLIRFFDGNHIKALRFMKH